MASAIVSEMFCVYRYEVEYEKGMRSVLHMIFEHDTASSCGMTLAVARIIPRSIGENSEVAPGGQDVQVL